MAGWAAVVAAVLIAVSGGFLIVTPPWSIPGALVLVVASIMFAFGVVTTHRRSWVEPWPPDVKPSQRRQLRRLQVRLVLSSVLIVATVGLAISAVIEPDWIRLVYAGILLASGCGNLLVSRRVLKQLREHISANAEVGES